MKNFILGLVVGLIISGGVAWAAVTTKILLVTIDSNNKVSTFGTSSNPIQIKAI